MAVYASNETELSLLGLFLTRKNTINEHLGLLDSDDFDNEYNKVIFNNINKLYEENKPIDLINLINFMDNNDDLQKLPNKDYLTSLLDYAGLESLGSKYVEILKEKTKLRQLKKFLTDQRTYLDHTDESVNAIIENIEEEIFKVTRESMPTKEIPLSSAIDDYISKMKQADYDADNNAILTDFKEFDNIVHGFRPGDLVILAARPSMGKTAFALALATNIAFKKHVYFFSLEMPVEQITQRILSSNALIDSNLFKNPNKIQTKDWAKLQEIKPILENLNLVIDDTPGIKLSELIWKIRNYAMNNPLNLVVIDYLTLITQKNSNSFNRQQEISDISRSLKTLARELKIPIVVLSQLNRGVEKREEKRPLMSDIRESGAIEQDADIICFLYREGYYKSEKNSITQPVEIIISKNRNGSTGTCKLDLNMATGKFFSN